jgi:uncharacterized protein (DUF2132 family)
MRPGFARPQRGWCRARIAETRPAAGFEFSSSSVRFHLAIRMTEQPHNPLHGITLEAILTTLVERHGWEALAQRINIRCFTNDPSIKSSLTFLRKTPWARQKVEAWYLYDLRRERPRSGGA